MWLKKPQDRLSQRQRPTCPSLTLHAKWDSKYLLLSAPKRPKPHRRTCTEPLIITYTAYQVGLDLLRQCVLFELLLIKPTICRAADTVCRLCYLYTCTLREGGGGRQAGLSKTKDRMWRSQGVGGSVGTSTMSTHADDLQAPSSVFAECFTGEASA